MLARKAARLGGNSSFGGTRFGGKIFAGEKNPGDRLAHRYDVAFARFDTSENAAGRRFNLNDSLVGFDVEQRLALRDGFALLFSPSQIACPFPGPSRERA